MNIKKVPEIILIDKPAGITSFDVIRRLRKKYNIKKMGHAGTLDPQATGLMIIGIEKGTKQLKNYVGLDKVYQAEILLGKKTDSGDLDGKILEEKKIDLEKDIDLAKIKKIPEKFQGKMILTVPRYSAMKQQGQPLYKLVRGNKKYIIPQREMEIYWLKLIKHWAENNNYILEIKLEVSSGTYIRSIAEEIGNFLNLPSTLKNLRRTQIGDLKIENAETI